MKQMISKGIVLSPYSSCYLWNISINASLRMRIARGTNNKTYSILAVVISTFKRLRRDKIKHLVLTATIAYGKSV